MTGRPQPPGQPLESFLNGLPDDDRAILLNRLGAGVAHAIHAGRCVTEAGTWRHETVPLLAAYLAAAIRALEVARAIVVEQMEGGVTR